MTAVLAQPVMYPVPQLVFAYTECAACCYVGRVEWLPNGTVRTLHQGHMCLIQLPDSPGLDERRRALLLIR